MARTLKSIGNVAIGVFLALMSNLVQAQQQEQCIQGTNDLGQQTCLDPNRKPALYTQNFGGCMTDSLIDVSMFNGAYYTDNSTVTWNMDGTTPLRNESIMSRSICSLPT